MFSVSPSHAQSRTAVKLPKSWASETDRVRAKARAAFKCCPERIKTFFLLELLLVLSREKTSCNDAWGSRWTPSSCRRRERNLSAKSSSKTRRVLMGRTSSKDSGLSCDCPLYLISLRRILRPGATVFILPKKLTALDGILEADHQSPLP